MQNRENKKDKEFEDLKSLHRERSKRAYLDELKNMFSFITTSKDALNKLLNIEVDIYKELEEIIDEFKTEASVNKKSTLAKRYHELYKQHIANFIKIEKILKECQAIYQEHDKERYEIINDQISEIYSPIQDFNIKYKELTNQFQISSKTAQEINLIRQFIENKVAQVTQDIDVFLPGFERFIKITFFELYQNSTELLPELNTYLSKINEFMTALNERILNQSDQFYEIPSDMVNTITMINKELHSSMKLLENIDEGLLYSFRPTSSSLYVKDNYLQPACKTLQSVNIRLKQLCNFNSDSEEESSYENHLFIARTQLPGTYQLFPRAAYVDNKDKTGIPFEYHTPSTILPDDILKLLPDDILKLIFDLFDKSGIKPLQEIINGRLVSKRFKNLLDEMILKPNNLLTILISLSTKIRLKFLKIYLPEIRNKYLTKDKSPLMLICYALSTDNLQRDINPLLLQEAINKLKQKNLISQELASKIQIMVYAIEHSKAVTEKQSTIMQEKGKLILENLANNDASSNLKEKGKKEGFVNLANINLNGINFENKNLENCNLQETTIVNLNLKAANLKNANFQNATLINPRLTLTNLENANFQGATIKIDSYDVLVSFLIAPNANFSNCSITCTSELILICPNLEGTDFSSAYLHNVFLDRVNINRANFAGARLENVTIGNNSSCVETNFCCTLKQFRIWTEFTDCQFLPPQVFKNPDSLLTAIHDFYLNKIADGFKFYMTKVIIKSLSVTIKKMDQIEQITALRTVSQLVSRIKNSDSNDNAILNFLSDIDIAKHEEDKLITENDNNAIYHTNYQNLRDFEKTILQLFEEVINEFENPKFIPQL